jgi:hypothetical protein
VGISLAKAPVLKDGKRLSETSSLRACVPWAPLLAAVGVLAWVIVYPHTPDLGAQVYRVGLFAHNGFSVWDNRWYAGHHLPGYSLVFPALGALIGLRTVGALSVLLSAALFERTVLDIYGPRARPAAVWFSLAALGDIWIGRITFALGVTFALAGVLALTRGRPRLSAVMALACAAASPVAGVLLALGAFTHWVVRRKWSSVMALAIAPLILVGISAAMFTEGGAEPFPVLSFTATVAVTLAFLWALPSGQRLLRVGAIVYLLACVLSLLIESPMGSNIERYGVLLAGPLLLCVAQNTPRPLGRARVFMALGAIALWTIWGPVRETVAVAGNQSTSAAYYVPVKRFLAAHGASIVRIEVPLTRSHWEAALLAESVSLARGWEKQLDNKYDGVLLHGHLTPGAYRAWLHKQAVSYVALPDTKPDPSSAQEARLIRGGLSYLRQVFKSRHWTIFGVLNPTPLVQGPGRLTYLGQDSFVLQAAAPGTFVIRVHYTPYWTLTDAAGRITETRQGWTQLKTTATGTIRVTARFSLDSALGLG